MLILGLALGCRRTPAEPSQEQQSGGSSAASTPVQLDPGNTVFRLKAEARVVAIGDLHGDFSATQKAFRLAGAIDESGRWAGGHLVIVQTGDQLDRGDDEAEILEFLTQLGEQAAAAGGAVHALNGNHETMNVLGDFRYVTESALKDFEGVQPASPHALQIPAPYESRARAFLPGGAIALTLAKRPLILMVGDTVFAHGGVLPAHVSYGIDRLNTESSEWMEGKRNSPPSPVVDPDGPVWTRLYGDLQPTPAVCEVLRRTLQLLGAQRMVVGHTVQEKGMSSACEGQVFRIDVGLAKYYGERPVQVLEMTQQGARILTETEH